MARGFGAWGTGWRRRIAIFAGVALVLAGGLAISTGIGHAGESCAGLDTALRNNLTFIADQQRNPDALSAARIANRQAVVDLIQQRRKVAGCTATVTAGSAVSPSAVGSSTPNPAATKAPNPASTNVVCLGSTVTLSGESGAPAASSNQFPVGTRLKVTNLDSNKSITVQVTGPSGSCVLLNNAAFELVRQPGKFLIRRAVVQRL
jgi:hypothetical protein